MIFDAGLRDTGQNKLSRVSRLMSRSLWFNQANGEDRLTSSKVRN